MVYSYSEPTLLPGVFLRLPPKHKTHTMANSMDSPADMRRARRRFARRGCCVRATRLFVLSALSCLMVSMSVLVSGSAEATKRMDKAVYGYSTSPYWRVGSYNAKLSHACQQRRFSQKRQYRYIISFVGEEGKAILGIASSTWNLYDPEKLASPYKNYHFFNDGYSNCEVYVTSQPVNNTP